MTTYILMIVGEWGTVPRNLTVTSQLVRSPVQCSATNDLDTVAQGTCEKILKEGKIGWGATMATGRQDQDMCRSMIDLYWICLMLPLIYGVFDLL